MKKVKNMLNTTPSDGVINNEPSQTIPDQSMTLKELLIRYAKGLPLADAKTPIWEGEEGFDIDPERLDLAEVEELAEKAREELAAINQRVKEAVHKKKAKSKKHVTDVEEVTEDETNN
jgi:hypothetical protein